MTATAEPTHAILPTPPVPVDLPGVELTENARAVLMRRYVRRGDDGKPSESVEEMFWRVAYHVAKVEAQWNADIDAQARAFYQLLTSKSFFPNSPTFTGAGTPLGQLAACFVLPISDDMGKRSTGIFQTLRDAALIQQTGGGNGFSFSRLRPKGALVKASAGEATGPVGFLRVYDHAFGEVAQGGTRRGANMAVLRVEHPDIEDFIVCKTNENAITNFNISVGISDAFMQAVEDDADWDLKFPDVAHPAYRGFDGTFEQAVAAGIPMKVYKTVKARHLFNQVVKQAHHNGEPGMLFLDAANRFNPVPHLYPLEATNPCFIGSTRIATSDGWVTIEQLANKDSSFWAATDNRVLSSGCGVALRPTSPAWKTREDVEVSTITTAHGFTITATSDHRFLTSDRGFIPLIDLRKGDRLLIQSGEGAWSQDERLPNQEEVREAMTTLALSGDRIHGHLVTRRDFSQLYAHLPERWSHQLGVVLGWIVGDGWLSPNSNSPVGLVFGRDSQECQDFVHTAMTGWFGPGHLHQRDSVNQLTYGRLPYRFFSSLGILALPADQNRVPASLWSAPRYAVVGFLQGLFSADGTVNLTETKRSCSIRLASASTELLREVQLLLLNFGIVSRLHKRRPAGLRQMPNGRGGLSTYQVKADYELIIDKANRDRFINEIGFIDSTKQQKAAGFIRSKVRRSNSESFETTVDSIEPSGKADVYDFLEPQSHSLIANGLVAHNCGEQWLGPYENCCLGSINLATCRGESHSVDWEKLRRDTVLSVVFLDDVIEANAYVPSVPALKEAALRARRIGLGIMGLADLMYHAGIRYGSVEGQEFASQVIEFVRYHAMVTSVDLARQRGAFPAIQGSIYDPHNLGWQPPQPIVRYNREFHRPEIDWQQVTSGIRKFGIRNAAQTTIAPTGTIATVAGCEGYGCEPVFALAYIRHVNDKGKDLQLTYASPLFEQALEESGLTAEARQAVIEQVMQAGSCQAVEELPAALRDTFVVSQDISAEEHVRMQAALQAFVDNSLSKTINFPPGATEEDVATAYLLAWKLGCKGITVYITGSREKVVLETHATAETRQPKPAASAQMPIWTDAKKPRPRYLPGFTYSIETPLGKAFITINENGNNQPFEIFVNTAKAGSETAAVSEALGRLISYTLRLASPILSIDRLREVTNQLGGIGGGRSLGFGPNRVRSLPDGLSQVLEEYIMQREDRLNGVLPADQHADDTPSPAHVPDALTTEPDDAFTSSPVQKIGDLCPECGEAAVVNEEGCRKCYACGYSEC